MNKEKIGRFLKSLREENKYSQEELCDVLAEKYGVILTSKAISGWENGKSIPDVDKLRCLSNMYKVSIDEILDGERRLDVDFMEEYFIAKENWGINLDKSANPYAMRQEQIIKIVNRFNELEIIRANRLFTHNEEVEFKFLFEHFYSLSEYYKEYTDLEIDSDYLKLKSAINNCIFKLHSSSKSDIVWEFKKLIIPTREISLSFNEFSDWSIQKNEYIINRFKKADFWEKDIILNQFQKHNFVKFDETQYGSRHLKEYEKRTGKKYNPELEEKAIIKFLIKNGACINPQYLNFIERIKEEKRVIDRLEHLYDLCLKPIYFSVGHVPGEIKYYKAENNIQNRFATKYYYSLYGLNDIPYDDLFKLFIEHEEFPRELIEHVAKKHNIDLNQEEKYIQADLNIHAKHVKEQWDTLHKCEKKIAQGLEEISKLESMLKNEQHYYFDIKEEEIGGKTQQESEDYCYFWNRFITYDELKKCRKVKETRELLREIDNLSIAEIRKKYFGMEIHNYD